MGSFGDVYDSVLAESFFASFECEVLDQNHFRTHEEARTAVFSRIEGWYIQLPRDRPLSRVSSNQPMVLYESEFG
jgi:putative transposase